MHVLLSILLNVMLQHGYNVTNYYCSMYTTIKKGKGDGNYGFTSDHLIYGGHRLHVLLSILLNVMLQHGYNVKDLFLSSIISISKDMKTYLSSSTNYRASHYLMP